MSWTLKLQSNGQVNLSSFEIAEDDVIFYAVLKRAQVEHSKCRGLQYKTRVRVLHLGEYDGEYDNEYDSEYDGKNDNECKRHIVFYMTLLESSKLLHYYPQFETRGLMGRWKLSTPFASSSSPLSVASLAGVKNQIEPFVSLVLAFEDSKVNDFLECAQSLKNPDFIRKSYLHSTRHQ